MISSQTENSDVVKILLATLKDIQQRNASSHASLEFYIKRRLDNSYKAYEEELNELTSSLLYFEAFKSKDKILKGI